MQGTSKPLPFNARDEIVNLFNAGLGLSWSDIPRNTRVPKGAVHKIVRHYSVHATTQPFSCFLVEVKILDNGWHPWSNWLALLPSALCRRFLMFTCDLLKNRFRSSKKNCNLSIYLQEYVYPIKERNAHVKNAIFIKWPFMREARWL